MMAFDSIDVVHRILSPWSAIRAHRWIWWRKGRDRDHSAQRKIEMYKLGLHAVSGGYVGRLSLHRNRHQLRIIQIAVKNDNSLSLVEYELKGGRAA